MKNIVNAVYGALALVSPYLTGCTAFRSGSQVSQPQVVLPQGLACDGEILRREGRLNSRLREISQIQDPFLRELEARELLDISILGQKK